MIKFEIVKNPYQLDLYDLISVGKRVNLNTHKTQVCHKYIFNGTLLNRQ